MVKNCVSKRDCSVPLPPARAWLPMGNPKAWGRAGARELLGSSHTPGCYGCEAAAWQQGTATSTVNHGWGSHHDFSQALWQQSILFQVTVGDGKNPNSKLSPPWMFFSPALQKNVCKIKSKCFHKTKMSNLPGDNVITGCVNPLNSPRTQKKVWEGDKQDFCIGETSKDAVNTLNSLRPCMDVFVFINEKYSHRAKTKIC